MNPRTLPTGYDITSDRRCPRCHKKLAMDVGANENEGDLEIRWFCLNDDYSERGPVNPTAARKSPYMAQLLARVRAGQDQGLEIPMRTDLPSVEEVEW